MTTQLNDFKQGLDVLRGMGSRDMVKHLAGKIVRDTATTEDYENYFQRLIEDGRTTQDSVRCLFKEHGFSSIQSYVEQKQEFIAAAKAEQGNRTEDYWNQRERFKGFIETRMIAMSRQQPVIRQRKRTFEDLRF